MAVTVFRSRSRRGFEGLPADCTDRGIAAVCISSPSSPCEWFRRVRPAVKGTPGSTASCRSQRSLSWHSLSAGACTWTVWVTLQIDALMQVKILRRAQRRNPSDFSVTGGLLGKGSRDPANTDRRPRETSVPPPVVWHQCGQPEGRCANVACHVRRSRMASRMSEIASSLGLAPTWPWPWRRTETLPFSMSRGPMASMV